MGVVTLLVLTRWHKLRLPIPGHLPAVFIGTLLSLLLIHFGQNVATIGSAFHYTLSDGTTGYGIPSVLPEFVLPWNLPNAEGNRIDWNLTTIQALLPAAFSMAMLGAIESLLCAVVCDNMTDTKHHSNNELLAQGLGNIASPFLGELPPQQRLRDRLPMFVPGQFPPFLVWFTPCWFYLPYSFWLKHFPICLFPQWLHYYW